MSQILEEQLSAFLDGELPREELDLLIARLDRDPAKRMTLGRYAMIGECVRSGAASTTALDVAERVRAALLEDKTPAPALERRSTGRWRGWAAGGIAAAAAVVAVIVARPGGQPSLPQPVAMATVESASGIALDEPISDIRPFVKYRLNPRAAARLTGYLVAHGQYANQLSRSTFDSHLVSARAERASWRQSQDLVQDLGNVR